MKLIFKREQPATIDNGDILKAAISATSLMTIYTDITSKLFHKKLGVTKILGSLLVPKKSKNKNPGSTSEEKILGIIMHYSVGILFTYCYNILWKRKILKINLKNGALLGLLNGVIGALGWEAFMKIHPNPPKINRYKYLANITIAHIAFGAAIAYYYKKAILTKQINDFYKQ